MFFQFVYFQVNQKLMNAKLIVLLFSGVVCVAQQNLRRAFQPARVVNKIPYGANVEAGNYVQSKDAKIYYEVYDKGQPLHGGIFDSTIHTSMYVTAERKLFNLLKNACIPSVL
jgi:hypothetical protein